MTERMHLAILRTAALLVPRQERGEWFAEWRAELWYVREQPACFCLGAFRDAFWLWRNSPTTDARHTFGMDSPLRCILFLAMLAAVSMFFAFHLPFARDMLLPSPYPDSANLVTISGKGRLGAQVPTIPIERFRSLARQMPYRFTGFAFYRPVKTPVQGSELTVGLASNNLFELLQIPISKATSGASLILSDVAWRKYFSADPHIVGRALNVDGLPAVVTGVIPAGFWRLPGPMDSWLLADQAQLTKLPPHTKGFVIGRLRPLASPAFSDPRWSLSVPNETGGHDRLECWSLDKRYLLIAYPLMTLFSLLILSTTTPLALGDYPANRHSPPGARRLRRWVFLSIKIALLLVIVCCGSLDLASLISANLYPTGWLAGLILSLRWALIDQRRRCPVCLRMLTNPTRIGGPSQTFLEWYGTELICAQGHGLLYVPEILTSCYSTQRWQYLDPSWSSLFSGDPVC